MLANPGGRIHYVLPVFGCATHMGWLFGSEILLTKVLFRNMGGNISAKIGRFPSKFIIMKVGQKASFGNETREGTFPKTRQPTPINP